MAKYDTYIDSQTPYVGEIPSHWKMVQNKRVMHKEKRLCESYNGQNIISLTLNGAIVRDLGAGGKMPASFDGYQYVYPGELLMCLFDIDVTPRCVGRVNNEGVTSPAYSSFLLHDNANLGYYYYYYLMLDYTKELLHLSKNLRHSLTEEQLGQIKVPLPPISEQKAISEYLDKKITVIDTIIEEARSSIEDYKAWKASIIYETITKGLNAKIEMKDSGVEWIGKIPSHWKLVRIKNIAEFMPKCDFSFCSNTTAITFTPMECIRTGSFENRSKLYGEIEGSYTQYAEGDIVLAKVTPCFENGNVCIMKQLHAGVGMGSSELFVLRPKKILDRFLLYFLQHSGFKDAACSTMSGTGGLKRVSSLFLQNCYIPYPNFQEQEKIANYLDQKCRDISSLIEEKELLVADLEAYKKSIIFEVVTGKKKVF